MILVDTSVWIDHLRSGNETLARLLSNGLVLTHPWVIGELALGNLEVQSEPMHLLRGLPQALASTDDEVLALIDREELRGAGIGYVDSQLLASTRLTRDARLWTNDKRLSVLAERLQLGFAPPVGSDGAKKYRNDDSKEHDA